MERININMCYLYKGTINSFVTLQKSFESSSITVITEYDEVVAICYSGNSLAKVLKDLDDNKYA